MINLMQKNSKGDFVEKIKIFFEELGIDPIYAATIFALLIVLSYFKELRDWERIADWEKLIISGAIIATIGLIIVSILRILGII